MFTEKDAFNIFQLLLIEKGILKMDKLTLLMYLILVPMMLNVFLIHKLKFISFLFFLSGSLVILGVIFNWEHSIISTFEILTFSVLILGFYKLIKFNSEHNQSNLKRPNNKTS